MVNGKNIEISGNSNTLYVHNLGFRLINSAMSIDAVEIIGLNAQSAVVLDGASECWFNIGTVIQGFTNSAVRVGAGSSLNLYGCEITNNSGNMGGGIYAEGRVSIYDGSVISSNSAHKGGGIYFTGENLIAASFHGMAYPDAVVFDSNSADYGGAVYFEGRNPAIVGFQNVGTFRNNKAKMDGGAIYADTTANLTMMLMSFGGMIANDFHNNKAGRNGGSIFVRNNGGELNFYSFSSSQRNNTAEGNGGTFYFDVTAGRESRIHIDSETISQNTANNGGAIFVEGEPEHLGIYGAFSDNKARAGTLTDDELTLFFSDYISPGRVSDHLKPDGTQGSHLLNNHDMTFREVETETPEIETPIVPPEIEKPAIPPEDEKDSVEEPAPDNDNDKVQTPTPPIPESSGNSNPQTNSNGKTSNNKAQKPIPNPPTRQRQNKPVQLSETEPDSPMPQIEPNQENKPKRENNIFYDEHFHKSYVTGFPDGSFQPDAFITRAEMSQIFFNLSNEASKNSAVMDNSSFTDVSADDWNFTALSYFVNMGVLSGYPDGSFKPNRSITNAEFAAFSVIAFNLEQLDIENNHGKSGNHWANFYLGVGFDERWFDYFGNDYYFHPDAYITRAQAVTLINYYTGRTTNSNEINAYLQNPIYNDLDRNHWAFHEITEATTTHKYTRSGQIEQMLFD
jgi:predicted outer membrane repeat protein